MRRRTAYWALLAFLTFFGGCKSLTDILDGVPKPSVKVLGVGLRGLSLSGASLVFDLEISNPYATSLPLVDLSYRLASGANAILEGKVVQSGSVPARGTQVIQLPANFRFSALLELLKGVKPGAVIGYQADFSLGVNAPVLGMMSLPFSHRGELPIPAMPQIELASFELAKLGLEETRATAHVRVKNTNQFPLDLSKLGLDFSLGEQEIARTSVSNAISLKPDETQTILVSLSFSPRTVGVGLLNLLRGNQIAYMLRGELEANTRFGPLSLPLSRIGNTPVRR
jgi:LEA14-like dessication related protein